MRGLAFPKRDASEYEDSCEYPSSFPTASNLPMDPPLHTPTDSAYIDDTPCLLVSQQPHHSQSILQPTPIRTSRQYSQAPQGDPFAPQLQPAYFQMDPSPAPPPVKPPKKRRRFRLEEECGFCQGRDDRNKSGVPEKLLTCSECGRSGHPSCLDLGQLGDAIRSYQWKCVECKSCEVCQEKGGDTRMLFCDACDRGWHMECLQPPLSEEPPGQWNCPNCPPLPPPPPPQLPLEEPPQELEHPVEPTPPPPSPEIPIDPALRETSVASSSKSVSRTSNTKKGRKGKPKTPTPIESEPDVPDPQVTRSPSTPRRSAKSRSRWKGKAPMRELPEVVEEPEPEPEEEMDVDAESEVVEVESPRPLRMRMTLRMPSPAPPQPPASPPKTTPIIRLRLPPRGKGKEREEEPEEVKKGMFDEFLSVEDRDITQTAIKDADKQRFEKSRISGELKLFPHPPVSSATTEVPETPVASSSSRPLRSATQYIVPSTTDPTPGPSTSPAPSSATPDPRTAPGLRIRTIRFGDFDIQTWYDAPFPEEYANIPDGRLWLCEFCLKYMKSQFVARRHQTKCKMRHPPGDEIYRDGSVSIFEVDGRKNKIYCQNLCLLSKMFLDHKSLFYDVEPFLFYVMTEVDDGGARFVGYFSKEKRSPKDYNVSCIMTLPVRQRQGWGNLLIDFSYLLSKKEQRPGSPEKPLSALGALGYRNYWTLALMRYLHTANEDPTLEDICTATSMTIEDIYTTLQYLGMISIREPSSQSRPLPGQSIKFPKGRKNGVARKHLQRTTTNDDEKLKGPFVPPKSYYIHWRHDTVEEYLQKWEAKKYLRLRPENLKWSPFLVARARKSDTLDGEGDAEGEMEEAVGLGQDGVVPGDGEEASVGTGETPRSRSRTGNSSSSMAPEEINGMMMGMGMGMATPKPGSSSRGALKNIRAEASPAAALFDDDVQVTTPTGHPPRRHSKRERDVLPTIPVVSSPESTSRPSSPEERRSPRKTSGGGGIGASSSSQSQRTPHLLRRSSRQTSSMTTPSRRGSPPQTPGSMSKQYQRRPVVGMRRNRSGGIRGVGGGGGGPPPTPASPLAPPNGTGNSQINANPNHHNVPLTPTPSSVHTHTHTPVDPSFAEDAALAEKLAMEEGSLPRRQLRSRSNTEQNGKLFTPPLPPLRRMSSSALSTTRKRKRVDSPVPMDVSGDGDGDVGSEDTKSRMEDVVPPTPTPVGRKGQVPRRSSFQVDKSDGMDFAVLPSVVSPLELKEPSDLVNGVGHVRGKGKGRSKAKGSGGSAGRGRGKSGRSQTSTSEPNTLVNTQVNGTIEARDETVQDSQGLVSLMPGVREGSSAPPRQDDDGGGGDVKTEETESPMMDATPGGQSAPSESTTLYALDEGAGAVVVKGSPEAGLQDVEMKVVGVPNEEEQEQEEEERVVRAEEEEEGEDEGLPPQVIPSMANLGIICDEGDADAEGEIDEGIDLDAEGELDIDAEGEPDDDVDAEGELDAEGEDDVYIDADGEIDLEEAI